MPAFNFSRGSLASVFGVSVYGRRSDAWWHKAFIRPVYLVGARVRDAVWQVRYRVDPRHRYHLIDTHLKPGYHDVDTLMLHGMFSLLRRYVEDEMGGADSIMAFNEELRRDPNYDPEDPPRQLSNQAEAVKLYQWWTVYLPAIEKRRDELLHLLYSDHPIETVPVEGTDLRQLVFRKRTEEQEAMHREMRALDERIEREAQEMLHRLIDISGSLWT